MQHNTITMDTLDCFKQTILQTLERMKILPGLLRFILSDLSLFRAIQRLAPLFQLFAPIFSADSQKFVRIDEMVENSANFTSFIQQRNNLTSYGQWYFSTRLVSPSDRVRIHTYTFLKAKLNSPADLEHIFCSEEILPEYVVSFRDSIKVLKWNLCKKESLYVEIYEEFRQQFGGPLVLKVNRFENEFSSRRVFLLFAAIQRFRHRTFVRRNSETSARRSNVAERKSMANRRDQPGQSPGFEFSRNLSRISQPDRISRRIRTFSIGVKRKKNCHSSTRSFSPFQRLDLSRKILLDFARRIDAKNGFDRSRRFGHDS